MTEVCFIIAVRGGDGDSSEVCFIVAVRGGDGDEGLLYCSWEIWWL